MEQFVHSTACTVQMQADTNTTTHSGSQSGKWQLPCHAPGQFVCCGGRLISPHHGTWRMQEPAGGRARRDNTQCPCTVPTGSSDCLSLLPSCHNYSLNLVLIGLPQWTSRCPAQGRVDECVRKRDMRREQAGEVLFTSADLLPTCSLFYGQLQMLLSFLCIPCCFNQGKFESDLNGHLHEGKVSDKTCSPASSLLSLGSMSFSCLSWWLLGVGQPLLHGEGPAGYHSWVSKALLLWGLMPTNSVLTDWLVGLPSDSHGTVISAGKVSRVA